MQKKDAKAIGSRVMAFLKKNIHYILMILCVIAIGVVVTVVAVLNTTKTNDVDVNKPNEPTIEAPDDEKPAVVEKKFALIMPVEGGVQGRAFSDTALSYNPTLSRYDAHLAVDIVGSEGANVYAGFEGTVTNVTTDAYYGGSVTIDYGKGYVATIRLINDVKVSKGDKVDEKTVLGTVGKFQFECKQDAHIHYELTQNNKLVDPMQYVVGDNK